MNNDWILKRVGVKELDFSLQEHLETIKLGRSITNHKQMISPFISRHQCTLHRILKDGESIYWSIESNQQNPTFVNGHHLPSSKIIRLNDGDLISFNQNWSENTVEENKLRFLYKVIGPSVNDTLDSISLEELTQVDPSTKELCEIKKEGCILSKSKIEAVESLHHSCIEKEIDSWFSPPKNSFEIFKKPLEIEKEKPYSKRVLSSSMQNCKKLRSDIISYSEESYLAKPSFDKSYSNDKSIGDIRQDKVVNSSELIITNSEIPFHFPQELSSSDNLVICAQLEILKWNTSWLKEQDEHKKSPKVSRIPLRLVPLSFTDHKEYIQVFYPLILYECWKKVYNDYKSCNDDQKYTVGSFVSMNCNKGHRMISIALRIILTSYKSSEFKSGSLILIQDDESGSKNIFGIVESESTILSSSSSSSSWTQNLEVRLHQRRKWSLEPEFKKSLYLRHVSSIYFDFRLLEALNEFKDSPLFDLLLKPNQNENISSSSKSINYKRQDLFRHLNKSQKDVIYKLGLSLTSKSSFVHCCEGPPGTGKTTTLATLIHFLNCEALAIKIPLPKILLVSPSNAAVDQILIKLKKDFSGVIVRIGVLSKFHPDVTSFSLENWVNEKEKEALKVYEDTIHRIKKEIKNQSNQNKDKISYLQRRLEIEQKKYRRAKLAYRKNNRSESLREDILRKANVVATTLSSSRNGIMTKIFGEKPYSQNSPSFDYCIIDEASQCVEPESLLALKYGFHKLVLVGDSQQLPGTVVSNEAVMQDYSTSLFSRLMSGGKISGVDSLRVQYRMHPEISDWPNRYFYGGDLINGASDRSSLWNPFLIFDSTWSQENKSISSFYNEDEVHLVAHLIDAVLQVNSNLSSLGVLTFYNEQKNRLASKLKNFPKIVVNTIDSFQGSELDIVILSTVRSHAKEIGFVGNSQRLNVALTRAKFALYIITNVSSLSSNPMWLDLFDNARRRKRMISVSQCIKSNDFKSFITLL